LDDWKKFKEENDRILKMLQAALATHDPDVIDKCCREVAGWRETSPYGKAYDSKLLEQANATAKKLFGRTFDEMLEAKDSVATLLRKKDKPTS